MSRESRNEVAPDGSLRSGYDYERQAWVKDGRYVRCGHVDPCRCYGRLHEGEPANQ